MTQERWQEAQRYEIGEWKDNRELLEMEWDEVVRKYSKLFPQIARNIEIHEHTRILEVGSMSTVPARLFGAGTIVALEPLAATLGITGREKEPAVTMVSARAEAMPFADRSFDVVLCRNVIDHTQDPQAGIREMHRVLKDDGYLLLICYTYAPFIAWSKNVSERLGMLRNVGHPHAFTPSKLERLVDGTFTITERYTIHVGTHSTDYGKTMAVAPDRSRIHAALMWANRSLFGSTWFLKEYGVLARKRA